MKTTILAAASLFTLAGLADSAWAQSSPSLFAWVFNIGTVPPGSPFAVTGAVTGTQVGDQDFAMNQAAITPGFLGGDTLGSNSQLNLFAGGTILDFFSAGLFASQNTNIEVNISGGTVGNDFTANSGSTVNISGGSFGDFFSAFFDSTVNISGGTVGRSFNAIFGSTVNISGGSVGDIFSALFDSTVNISAGSVGDFFGASSDSTVNISGGSVGDFFSAFFDSTVNISGGSVGDFFSVFSDSTVNISGGSVGEDFQAEEGSTVNLFGTAFFLDGVELTGLILGEAFTITDRDVTLTGLLADGSAFDFALNSNDAFLADFFSTGATLTVTLVPAPGAAGVLAMAGLVASRRRRG